MDKPPRRARSFAPGLRRAAALAAFLAVGATGAGLGLALAGSTRTDAGPFVVSLSLRPFGGGETVVDIAPLGQLTLDTHHGPVALNVDVVEVREAAVRSLLADPDSIQGVGADVQRDLRGALMRLVLRALVVAVLGALALGLLVFRGTRRTLATGLAGLTALTGAGVLAVATFNQRALSEPKYSGLLAAAPAAVGDVRDVVERVDLYSQSLGRLVGNVGQLYSTASGLPTFRPTDDTIKVLSVADLHLSPSAYDVIGAVVEQFSVDVVVDAGDSTDFGSPAEAGFLAGIGRLGVPYVWVRGNHDSMATQQVVAAQSNAVVLDSGKVRTVAGVRFLGRGNPRFTPDKRTGDDDADPSVLVAQGQQLRRDAILAPRPEVIVVHEQAAARELFGTAPLVLAGHTHQRSAQTEEGTLLLIQGSTGGAGLRALEGDDPTPVAMSVIYLDRSTRAVVARDDITLGGLGLTSAQIERSVAGPLPQPRPSPS